VARAILLTIRIVPKKRAAQEAKPAEAISETILTEPGKPAGKVVRKAVVRQVILSKVPFGMLFAMEWRFPVLLCARIKKAA